MSFGGNSSQNPPATLYGELCLARKPGAKLYRPGKIVYSENEEVHDVRFADGSTHRLNRKAFYLPGQPEFATCRVNFKIGWKFVQPPTKELDFTLDLDHPPSASRYRLLSPAEQLFFVTPVLDSILDGNYTAMNRLIYNLQSQHKFLNDGPVQDSFCSGFMTEDQVKSILIEIEKWCSGEQPTWPNNRPSGAYIAMTRDMRRKFSAAILLPAAIAQIHLWCNEDRTSCVLEGEKERHLYYSGETLRQTRGNWPMEVKRLRETRHCYNKCRRYLRRRY